MFKTISASLKDLRQQKKAYKECVRRSKALPNDYHESLQYRISIHAQFRVFRSWRHQPVPRNARHVRVGSR